MLLVSSKESTPKRLRVLCVDDDPSVAKILKLALERSGHEVDVAGDGRHAFERVTAGAYDVVVTDHQMPNMNGLDLVMTLRSSGFPGKIVVHASPLGGQLAESYRVLRVDRIVQKPSKLDAFLDAVEG